VLLFAAQLLLLLLWVLMIVVWVAASTMTGSALDDPHLTSTLGPRLIARIAIIIPRIIVYHFANKTLILVLVVVDLYTSTTVSHFGLSWA
jgi:hypothetical protein